MEKMSTKQVAGSVAQNVLRKGYVLQDTSAFDLVPDIVDSVRVDGSVVCRTIEEMGGGSRNPLNALLGLLGFQIVRRWKNENDYDVALESTGTDSTQMLRVDEAKLDNALVRLADALKNKEDAFQREKQALEARYDTLRKEYSEYREETDSSITEHQVQIQNVAANIQYLMSLRRSSGNPLLDCAELETILTELGLRAVWPEDTENIASMFTVLKTDTPEGIGVKPCILAVDKVVLRGMIIKLADTSILENASVDNLESSSGTAADAADIM